MGQKEFLAKLGFSANPFEFTNADQEEHLHSYFVPPPYFDSVWGDPGVPKSQVIFAPRGGGKSAQRRMIEYRAKAEDVFAITYDRFEQLSGADLNALGLDYHLSNVLRLALLGFLLEYRARGMQAPAFSHQERQLIEALAELYLRKVTKVQALEALNSLEVLSSKAREFLREWSGPLSALASAALGARGMGEVRVESAAGHEVQAGEVPTKAHLEIIRDLIQSVGFKCVYVLVDKVDETNETGNDASASFLLMRPLLRDLELLELNGVAFKFFLWDKLLPHYREYARPDRLQQFELSWTGDEIYRMLSRRLEVFSEGAVSGLSQLTTAELATRLQVLAVLFANGSPRDVIRVCREIVSEQLQVDPESRNIGEEAVERGILKFSSERAQELVAPDTFKDLVKVGRADFTTNLVANQVFRITLNSARNKIGEWIAAGAVEKVGELYSGARPVYQYALADVRLARGVFAQSDLFSFVGSKLRWCAKCRNLLIRDWDLQDTHSCHKCGFENKL